MLAIFHCWISSLHKGGCVPGCRASALYPHRHPKPWQVGQLKTKRSGSSGHMALLCILLMQTRRLKRFSQTSCWERCFTMANGSSPWRTHPKLAKAPALLLLGDVEVNLWRQCLDSFIYTIILCDLIGSRWVGRSLHLLAVFGYQLQLTAFGPGQQAQEYRALQTESTVDLQNGTYVKLQCFACNRGSGLGACNTVFSSCNSASLRAYSEDKIVEETRWCLGALADQSHQAPAKQHGEED